MKIGIFFGNFLFSNTSFKKLYSRKNITIEVAAENVNKKAYAHIKCTIIRCYWLLRIDGGMLLATI